MTKSEWLEIGISKGIVEIDDCEKITFLEAFQEWFKMKMTFIKAQSLDRIEVTYKRYFEKHLINDTNISDITDDFIISFILFVCKNNKITYKEMGRIMQIMKGVMVYMRDINKGGVMLHDWEKVKRNVPLENMAKVERNKYAISKVDIEKMISCVMSEIYLEKQSACLCLCLNFYLGLRVGELAALEFTDFDLNKNVVHISKTESKYYERLEDGSKVGAMVYRVVDSTKTVYSVRDVPLLPEAIYIYNMIRKHHKEMGYDSTYLCYDGKNTVMVRSLDRTLRKLLAKCEIPYFNTHAIRKSFATILHYNGVPSRVISDLLGHSEVGTTENCYILSYDENYKNVYEMMKNSLNYTLR